ncbi:MAG: hypothetical protein E4H17_04565 [Gemmatimonadales bacterium]|nr:MAG: hypothetical protein E4H17_04565 [Gemmatimonadales bacterium]
MTHPQRCRAVLQFQPVDRLPRIEWAGFWDKTLARWRTEGLSPQAGNSAFDIRHHLGLDPYWQLWITPWGKDTPKPVRHGAGIVSDQADYERVRPTLYPRYALENMADRLARQQAGELVVWYTLEGFFWFPRTLLGIEPHLYAFYDQAELMHRINADLLEYNLWLVERIRSMGQPVFMTIAEDMSYNHGPMLSRGLFEEFIAPYYRPLTAAIHEAGTHIVVDTDGDVTEMIPWMQSAGVDGCLPLERQAGADGMAIRRAHPRRVMLGHYDKMVMNRGQEALRGEFERLGPLMQSGGYIPSVDHQTPPGVSLEQYRDYLRLLEEYSVRFAPR